MSNLVFFRILDYKKNRDEVEKSFKFIQSDKIEKMILKLFDIKHLHQLFTWE
jgi:hypothetical protein